jgi:hypothetical protein
MTFHYEEKADLMLSIFSPIPNKVKCELVKRASGRSLSAFYAAFSVCGQT